MGFQKGQPKRIFAQGKEHITQDAVRLQQKAAGGGGMSV